MTERDYLRDLKRIAKEHARAQRIPLAYAQNSVAERLGLPHWPALAKKVKLGHQLTAQDVAAAEGIFKEASETFPDEGLIGRHSYRLEVVLDDVIMSGRGWEIRVYEAPSSSPQCLVTDRRYKNNPLHDPEFVTSALRIAELKIGQVRSSIAKDWPRNATKPDGKGRVLHPIYGGRSDAWYCLHCDRKASGRALAENFWHCPSCGASPIDVFKAAWWSEPRPEHPTSPE